MKRINTNVDKVLHSFNNILKKKPALPAMLEEIRMMQFKIKPVSGDVGHLNFKNSNFIEMIWSLGKLEEVLQKEYAKLTLANRKLLLRIFDSLYDKFQERLNKVSMNSEYRHEDESKLEIEIFKEQPRRKLN